MLIITGMKGLTTTLLLAAVISISSACGASTSTNGQASKANRS